MPDVSSSEITPHPGEVTHDLNRAIDKLRMLRNAATVRGDEAGAKAWSDAAEAITKTIATVGEARSAQTWAAKRTEPCTLCRR